MFQSLFVNAFQFGQEQQQIKNYSLCNCDFTYELIPILLRQLVHLQYKGLNNK